MHDVLARVVMLDNVKADSVAAPGATGWGTSLYGDEQKSPQVGPTVVFGDPPTHSSSAWWGNWLWPSTGGPWMLEVGMVSLTTSPSTDVTRTSAGKVKGTPENNSHELSLVDCIAAKLLCPWVLMDTAATGTRVLDTFTLM